MFAATATALAATLAFSQTPTSFPATGEIAIGVKLSVFSDAKCATKVVDVDIPGVCGEQSMTPQGQPIGWFAGLALNDDGLFIGFGKTQDECFGAIKEIPNSFKFPSPCYPDPDGTTSTIIDGKMPCGSTEGAARTSKKISDLSEGELASFLSAVQGITKSAGRSLQNATGSTFSDPGFFTSLIRDFGDPNPEEVVITFGGAVNVYADAGCTQGAGGSNELVKAPGLCSTPAKYPWDPSGTPDYGAIVCITNSTDHAWFAGGGPDAASCWKNLVVEGFQGSGAHGTQPGQCEPLGPDGKPTGYIKVQCAPSPCGN